MYNGFDVTNLCDINGKPIADVFVARNPLLTEIALEYGKEHRKQVKNDYHTYAEDTTDIRHPSAGAMLIGIEMLQAKSMAEHLLSEHILPSEHEMVPVIYAPDSALHVVQGFTGGLKGNSSTDTRYKIYTHDPRHDQNEDIAQEALQLAQQTGGIVFCENIINHAGTCTDFLSRIPDNIFGPEGKPIEIIIYSSFMYRRENDKGITGIEAVDKMQQQCPPNCNLTIFVADTGNPLTYVGEIGRDPCNRADLMAYVDHPYTRALASQLLRRKDSPFASHSETTGSQIASDDNSFVRQNPRLAELLKEYGEGMERSKTPDGINSGLPIIKKPGKQIL